MDGFTKDDHVQKVAQAYALDAIDLADRNFNVELDWGIESIRKVEEMLTQFHNAIAFESPSQERLEIVAKAMGSYVGEVIRREHGGDWGMLKIGDQEYVGMSHGIMPWARAHKRIVNGPEDNIWHYYVLLFRATDENQIIFDSPTKPKGKQTRKKK